MWILSSEQNVHLSNSYVSHRSYFELFSKILWRNLIAFLWREAMRSLLPGFRTRLSPPLPLLFTHHTFRGTRTYSQSALNYVR